MQRPPFTLLVLLLCAGLLGACAESSDAPQATTPEANPPEATRPGTGSADGDEAADGASGSLSPATARDALEAVYAPIHNFYEGMHEGPDGNELPPDDMSTPEALRTTLERTMAPDVATPFIDQLLMERGGRYIVRPTERIITPYPGGPALESIEVEPQGDTFVVTAYYAESELYGRLVQEHVLQKTGADGWKLIELRRADESGQETGQNGNSQLNYRLYQNDRFDFAVRYTNTA